MPVGSSSPISFREAFIWTGSVALAVSLPTLLGGRIGLKRSAARQWGTRETAPATTGMVLGSLAGAGIGTVAVAALIASGL